MNSLTVQSSIAITRVVVRTTANCAIDVGGITITSPSLTAVLLDVTDGATVRGPVVARATATAANVALLLRGGARVEPATDCSGGGAATSANVGAFGFAMPSGTSATNISVSVVGPGTLIRCANGGGVNSNVKAFVGLVGVAVASTPTLRNISVTASGAQAVFDAAAFITSWADAHVGAVGVAVYNTSLVAGINITVGGAANVTAAPTVSLQSSTAGAVGGVGIAAYGVTQSRALTECLIAVEASSIMTYAATGAIAAYVGVAGYAATQSVAVNASRLDISRATLTVAGTVSSPSVLVAGAGFAMVGGSLYAAAVTLSRTNVTVADAVSSSSTVGGAGIAIQSTVIGNLSVAVAGASTVATGILQASGSMSSRVAGVGVAAVSPASLIGMNVDVNVTVNGSNITALQLATGLAYQSGVGAVGVAATTCGAPVAGARVLVEIAASALNVLSVAASPFALVGGAGVAFVNCAVQAIVVNASTSVITTGNIGANIANVGGLGVALASSNTATTIDIHAADSSVVSGVLSIAGTLTYGSVASIGLVASILNTLGAASVRVTNCTALASVVSAAGTTAAAHVGSVGIAVCGGTLATVAVSVSHSRLVAGSIGAATATTGLAVVGGVGFASFSAVTSPSAVSVAVDNVTVTGASIAVINPICTAVGGIGAAISSSSSTVPGTFTLLVIATDSNVTVDSIQTTTTNIRAVVGAVGAAVSFVAGWNAASVSIARTNATVMRSIAYGYAVVGAFGLAASSASLGLNNTTVSVLSSTATTISVGVVSAGCVVGLLGVATSTAAPGMRNVAITAIDFIGTVQLLTGSGLFVGAVGAAVQQAPIVGNNGIVVIVRGGDVTVGTVSLSNTAMAIGAIGAAVYSCNVFSAGTTSVSVVATGLRTKTVAVVSTVSAPVTAIGGVGVLAYGNCPFLSADVVVGRSTVIVGSIGALSPMISILDAVGAVGMLMLTSQLNTSTVQATECALTVGAVRAAAIRTVVGLVGTGTVTSSPAGNVTVFTSRSTASVSSITGLTTNTADAIVVGGVGVAAQSSVAWSNVTVLDTSAIAPNVTVNAPLRFVGGIGMATNAATGDAPSVSAVAVARSTVSCPGGAASGGAVSGIGAIGSVVVNPPTSVVPTTMSCTTLVESCRVNVAVVSNTVITADSPPAAVGGIGAVLTGASLSAAWTAVAVLNTTLSVGAVARYTATVGGVGVVITAGTAMNNTSINVTNSDCSVASVSTATGGVAVGLLGVAVLPTAAGLALTGLSVVTSNCTATVGPVTATVVAGGIGVSSWSVIWRDAVQVVSTAVSLGVGVISVPAASVGPRSVVGGIGVALYQSPSSAAHVTVIATAATVTVGNISASQSLAAAVGAVGIAAASRSTLTSSLASTAVHVLDVTAQVAPITVVTATTLSPPHVLTAVGGFGVAVSNSPVVTTASVSGRRLSLVAFVPSTPDGQVTVGVAGVACADSLVPTAIQVSLTDVQAVVRPRPTSPLAGFGSALAVVGGVGAALYTASGVSSGTPSPTMDITVSGAAMALGNWSAPMASSLVAVGAVGVANRVFYSQIRSCTVAVANSTFTVGTVRSQLAVGAVGVVATGLIHVNNTSVVARNVSADVGSVETGGGAIVGLVGVIATSLYGRLRGVAVTVADIPTATVGLGIAYISVGAFGVVVFSGVADGDIAVDVRNVRHVDIGTIIGQSTVLAAVGAVGVACQGSASATARLFISATDVNASCAGIVATGHVYAAVGSAGYASTTCTIDTLTLAATNSRFIAGLIGSSSVGFSVNAVVGGVGAALYAMSTIINAAALVANTRVNVSSIVASSALYCAVGAIGLAAFGSSVTTAAAVSALNVSASVDLIVSQTGGGAGYVAVVGNTGVASVMSSFTADATVVVRDTDLALGDISPNDPACIVGSVGVSLARMSDPPIGVHVDAARVTVNTTGGGITPATSAVIAVGAIGITAQGTWASAIAIPTARIVAADVDVSVRFSTGVTGMTINAAVGGIGFATAGATMQWRAPNVSVSGGRVSVDGSISADALVGAVGVALNALPSVNDTVVLVSHVTFNVSKCSAKSGALVGLVGVAVKGSGTTALWNVSVAALGVGGISDTMLGMAAVGGVGFAAVLTAVRGLVVVGARAVDATVGAINATTNIDVGAVVGCIGVAFYTGTASLGPGVAVHVSGARIQQMGIIHNAVGSIVALTGAVGVASSLSMEQVAVDVGNSTFAIGPIGFTTSLGRALNSAVGGVGVAIYTGSVANVSIRVASTDITASTMRAITGIAAAVGTVGVATSSSVTIGNLTVDVSDCILSGLGIGTDASSIVATDAPTIVGSVGAAACSGGFGTVRITTVNCSITASPILNPGSCLVVGGVGLAFDSTAQLLDRVEVLVDTSVVTAGEMNVTSSLAIVCGAGIALSGVSVAQGALRSTNATFALRRFSDAASPWAVVGGFGVATFAASFAQLIDVTVERSTVFGGSTAVLGGAASFVGGVGVASTATAVRNVTVIVESSDVAVSSIPAASSLVGYAPGVGLASISAAVTGVEVTVRRTNVSAPRSLVALDVQSATFVADVVVNVRQSCLTCPTAGACVALSALPGTASGVRALQVLQSTLNACATGASAITAIGGGWTAAAVSTVVIALEAVRNVTIPAGIFRQVTFADCGGPLCNPVTASAPVTLSRTRYPTWLSQTAPVTDTTQFATSTRTVDGGDIESRTTTCPLRTVTASSSSSSMSQTPLAVASQSRDASAGTIALTQTTTRSLVRPAVITTRFPASHSRSFTDVASASATQTQSASHNRAHAPTHSATPTALPRQAKPPPVTGRSPAGVAATWVTIAAQFAQARIGALTALRAQSVIQSLRRIGSDEGCRGQDPTAVPDWLSSPLGLGMADGSDYVTGTAVGAPATVLIAAVVGAAVGVVGHALAHVVIYPLRSLIVRALKPATSTKAMRVMPMWGRRAQDVLPPSAAGAATGMFLMAGVVSQSAAAAATLRLAEGAVAGTPTWYPAAAAVGALVTVALPTTALFVAWPRRALGGSAPPTVRHATPPPRTSERPLTRGAMAARDAFINMSRSRILFAGFARRLEAMPLRLFRPKGLKRDWARPTDRGEWQTLSPTARLTSPLRSAAGSARLAPAPCATVRPLSPLLVRPLSPLLVRPLSPLLVRPLSPLLSETHHIAANGTLLRAAGTNAPELAFGDLMPALVLPTALSSAAFHNASLTWQAPARYPGPTGVVRSPNRAEGAETVHVAAPPPPGELARHAWCEALYNEYCGRALAAAEFVVASQALQGVAQAAGELVTRHADGSGPGSSAWLSCIASAATQTAAMALCTAVCLWARPQNSRRNWLSELLPSAVQTGLCVPVLILAARRHAPTASIVAVLEWALETTGFLQPALAVVLALVDAVLFFAA
jgi:hypothetical protein